MLLHLGGNVSVQKKDVIGIFDIDDENTGEITKAFLKAAEKGGDVTLAGDDLPKSFVLAASPRAAHSRGAAQRVILCKVSARNLTKRCCEKELWGAAPYPGKETF